MTASKLTVEEVQAQRHDLQAQLGDARLEHARTAYTAATEGYDGRHAAAQERVRTLEAAIAHLSAVEVGALEAEEARREGERAKRKAAARAEADTHAADVIKQAERIDDLIAETLATWAALGSSLDAHTEAMREVADTKAAADSVSLMASDTQPLTDRISALFARGGLMLPAGIDVMRTADVVAGHPEQGLSSLTGAAEDRLLKGRRLARAGGDDRAARTSRVVLRAKPEVDAYPAPYVGHNASQWVPGVPDHALREARA